VEKPLLVVTMSGCMSMSDNCPFDTANANFPIQLPFSWWTVASRSALPGACAAVFCLGLLRHFLSALRLELFLANALPLSAFSQFRAAGGDGQSLLPDEGGSRPVRAPTFAPLLTARLRPYLVVGALRRSPLVLRVADALMFGAGALVGFFNMLVVCVARAARRVKQCASHAALPCHAPAECRTTPTCCSR
jgi:hypothetical protein